MSTNLRTAHPGRHDRESEGRSVAFTFNGTRYQGFAGEPLAYALYASGARVLGRHDVDGAARGLFCGIGHCYGCLVTVGGIPNVRACLWPVEEGLVVTSVVADGGGSGDA